MTSCEKHKVIYILLKVGGEGFEPTKPKQQIYSLPHLTALETSRLRVQI